MLIRKRLLIVSAIAGQIFSLTSVQAASVKETIEMLGLMGTWAIECRMPASELNPYVVYRPVEHNVQREVVLSATMHSDSSLVDRAVNTKPNELFMSMANAQRRINMVVAIDPAFRIRTMESAIERGSTLISGGRLIETGKELPWLSKCMQ